MYLEERGDTSKSYARIAEKFGVSRTEVCYPVGLVNRLPENFVVWLERQDEPDVLRLFSERRLRPITRMVDQPEQWTHLKKLSGQLDRRLSFAKRSISRLANESKASTFISRPRNGNLLG